MWALTGAVLLLCGAACAEGDAPASVLVHFDTDAPLPASPTGERRLDDGVPALFDTLDVAVLQHRGRVARGSQRQVSLTAEMFENGPISFAVVPPSPTVRVVLQLVLFRAAQSESSYPKEELGVGRRINLPMAGAEGQTEVFVRLSVDDTGRREGWRQPKEPSLDVPAQSKVGTWPGAKRRECEDGAASEDEVCIPGGAFWMGDPGLRGNPNLEDSDREQLVSLSAYFLDKHEVTVEEFRAVWPDLDARGLQGPPAFSGDRDGQQEDDYATFTPDPPAPAQSDAHAKLPVNGIPWATARAFCQSRGKDLPTEAMFEYVASGLGRETPYVWGTDAPACGDTVIASAGFGAYANNPGSCRSPGTIGGPAEISRIDRDRIEIGADKASAIVGLAGNVAEWTLDGFQDQSELPEQVSVRYDPVQESTLTADDRRVIKGGSWRGALVEARAGARWGFPAAGQNRAIGFRCARATATAATPANANLDVP